MSAFLLWMALLGLYGRLQANLGYLALAQAHPQEAARHFQSAIALDEHLACAWRGYGMALSATGDGRSALRAYEAALALAPDDALSRLHRADARLTLGDEAGAIADWQSAHAAALLLRRGHRALAGDDLEAAIAAYELAVRVAPEDWRGYHYLAAALTAKGMLPEAAARLRQGLSQAPDSKLLFALGRNEYALGRYAEAIEALSRYIERFPQDLRGWYWRGMAYEKMCRPSAAIADYEAAIARAPDDANPHLALARLLERSGDRESALREYRAVLTLLPEHAESQRAIERLTLPAPGRP